MRNTLGWNASESICEPPPIQSQIREHGRAGALQAEINELWEAWTPSEVAQRMSRVSAPWYVAAGWALELFTARCRPRT